MRDATPIPTKKNKNKTIDIGGNRGNTKNHYILSIFGKNSKNEEKYQ